jgi:hypothetical protein
MFSIFIILFVFESNRVPGVGGRRSAAAVTERLAQGFIFENPFIVEFPGFS